MPIKENLVPNFSFEEKSPGTNLPQGWIWDKRNTNATCEIDESRAHSGKYSLKLTNGTPFGAHIYGTIWTAQPIKIKPGIPYTLSAYVLSENPGVAWIGGGSEWQIRLTIPPTKGKWKRIWLTFTPGEDDADFVLRINTDSPTPGFWVDDVKLEEGTEPTPCSYKISKFEMEKLWDEKRDFRGDGEISLSFLVYSPNAIVPSISLKLDDLDIFSKEVRIPSGISRLTLKGKASKLTGVHKIILLVKEGGKMLFNSDYEISFLSSAGAEERLKKITDALPDLKKILEELKKKGEDISYPMVTYTVLENFTKYCQEDISYYEEKKEEWVLKRALFALDDMEEMLKRLSNQLQMAKAGKLHFPKVPRWTGKERPQIVGSSFIAPTITPGSSPRRRPFFFNGYGAFGQVREDIEKLPSYGANIIQIEFGPVDIFPKEGLISDTAVKEFIKVLDRAEKAGVAVNLLISPHYFPEWMLEKYPHLRKKRDGFLQYCLHAPESKELLLRYIKEIIPPIKDHPALHSICLSNEPVNLEEPCEYALRDWHDWLRKKHGDIATLNNRWRANYSSFEEIPLLNPFAPDFNLRTPIGMDWVLFNQEWFAGWHKMLADAIHEIAPDLPVHAKAMTWTLVNDGDVKYGVDAELFADFSQINGNDSVNFYSHNQGEFAQGWQGNLIPYDLQRSMKNIPIYNSENHIIPDRETRYIPPEHIRCALWQQAIYGQGASTIWVWERTFDPKSDFAGSIMHRPLCAEAVGIVNYDLNRLAEYITAIQNTKPQVALIMSNSAKVWDTGSYSDCLGKLYTALSFCGIRISFVSERQLERGEVPPTPLLFVTNIHHLSDKAFEGLRNYKGRIVLVGEGELLNFNEYDKPREERIEGERLEYRYGETTWQDLWLKLTTKLVGWGIKQPVEVTDRSGKPIWGVVWLSRETEKGILVNLCNYRNEKVEIKLRKAGKTALDLVSGKRIGTDAIVLSPLETKLLLLERK
ncbi:beta-galactosidase [bacterium]|nr:beta-galactosidase [bacterium]